MGEWRMRKLNSLWTHLLELVLAQYTSKHTFWVKIVSLNNFVAVYFYFSESYFENQELWTELKGLQYMSGMCEA